MKKMRIRKWLKAQKSRKIYLNNGEDTRIGQPNVEKAMRLSRRYRKQILINVQPKVEIYDESSLMFSDK